MTTPKTAQQINDPQTGHVSTSRHSALSELMIQNAELREQLRVLQSAYDSLSQMKEKQVASRIDTDELKEENANMKNDLALWAKYFDKQWPKDVHETIERLKAENARLAAASERVRVSLSHGLDMIRVGNTDASYTHVLRASVLLEKPQESLDDLIAPTIELLDRLHGYLPEDDRSIRNELARLRGMV